MFAAAAAATGGVWEVEGSLEVKDLAGGGDGSRCRIRGWKSAGSLRGRSKGNPHREQRGKL